MILIPQIFLKAGKLVKLEGTTSSLFEDDALASARRLKGLGAESLSCVDLSVTPVGNNPNFPIIKAIDNELDMDVFVEGAFKTPQEVEMYIRAGAKLVILGTLAYQKPEFLREICKSFPGKIGTHIDVRAGKVTIPGYAVTTNKAPLDYAEYFLENGVRFILYSDVNAQSQITDENVSSLENFCLQTRTRVLCTSDVSSMTDIEKICAPHIPRLDGIIVSKAMYQNRIDIKAAIGVVNDMSISSESETTLADV